MTNLITPDKDGDVITPFIVTIKEACREAAARKLSAELAAEVAEDMVDTLASRARGEVKKSVVKAKTGVAAKTQTTTAALPAGFKSLQGFRASIRWAKARIEKGTGSANDRALVARYGG